MTNEEFKLSRIEEKLDFIIYVLGFVDLGEIPKHDAEHFNMLYNSSLKRMSLLKAKSEASGKIYELTTELNNLLQDWPELKDSFKFDINDK
jgi:hypothetical protein